MVDAEEADRVRQIFEWYLSFEDFYPGAYAIGRGVCKRRRLTRPRAGIGQYLSQLRQRGADRSHVIGCDWRLRVEDRELINEFLIESAENLTRLETEIVDLEQRPQDPGLLASIFRTIHTIKGTCGFLAF